MKKTITRLTFVAAMVLSLSVSATDAFAKDTKPGRETAWTDLEPLPVPTPVDDQLPVPTPVEDQPTVAAPVEELVPLEEQAEENIPEGVTWE